MDAELKKILKAVVLEMRHELEGYYDNAGKWHPGDLETRLAEIGVRKDRASVPVDELGRLIDEDVRARKIVDAFIDVREQAGVNRAEAVAEYIRESAYTWANRLVALRCMEARELLDDEVIVGREAYGGRSLVHHRLAQSSPELCSGEDDGRFAMLAQVFGERAKTLPMLFDPDSPSIALRPSPAALKNCLAWLSGTQKIRSQEPATDAVFAAPDALGWAYQYWNTEEKDRVFETVRTKKGAKIKGADIIPATQLYTEDYMVKFLVQNSLGATWMGMNPESKLFEGWEYYVRDTDRAPTKKKPLQQVTLLDPACGSGHFLIEAFDILYTMYEEEGSIKDSELICKSILENNLFGIDIDERAIQIAEASLWMKAEEKSFGFSGANTNLVAATSSHLKGESWERYLAKLQREPSTVRVLRKFAVEMEHIDELGSLARPADALESIINEEHEIWERQERERREADKSLFQEIRDDLLASQLPFQDISDKEFFERTMSHALFAIDGFTAEAREAGEFNDQLMGAEAKTGFRLLELLGQKYDVVVANPPYMTDKNMSSILSHHLGQVASSAATDLFAAFLENGTHQAQSSGFVAMIVQRVLMYNKDYESLRVDLLNRSQIRTVGVLGPGCFSEISGEVVDSILVILQVNAARTQQVQHHGVFIDVLRETNKQESLLQVLANAGDDKKLFKVDPSYFGVIEGSPWAYQLSENTFSMFKIAAERGRKLKCRAGISTGDDPRYLRLHFEVHSGSGRWMPIADGGQHERWYRPTKYVIDCESNFVRERNNLNESGQQRCAIRNIRFQGKPGITYLKNAGDRFAARVHHEGTFFLDTSRSTFPCSDEMLLMLGVLNTRCISWLLCLIGGGGSFVNTDVERLPFDIEIFKNTELSALVTEALNLSKEISRSESVSLEPFVLDKGDADLRTVISRFLSSRKLLIDRLQEIEDQIEELVQSLLNLIVTDKEKFPVAERLDTRSSLVSLIHTSVLKCIGHRWGGTSVLASYDADGIVPFDECVNEVGLYSLLQRDFTTNGCDNTWAEILRAFEEEFKIAIPKWLHTGFWPQHVSDFEKRPIVWQFQSSAFTSRKSPAFACLVYYHRIDVDSIPKILSQYTGPLKLRFETERRGISTTPLASRTDSQNRRAVELEESIGELHAFEAKLGTIAKSGFGPTNLLPTLRQYAFDDAMLSMKACWLQRLTFLLQQSVGENAGKGVRKLSPLNGWKDQATKTALHQSLAEWIGDALSHLSYFCNQVGPKTPIAKQALEDPTAADFGSLIQAEITPMQTGAMKLACGVWWGKFDSAVLAPIRERIKILKAEQKELNAAIKEDRQPVLIAEEVYEESEEDDGGEIESAVTDMPLLRNHEFEPTVELTKAAMKARLKEVKAKIKKFSEEMDSKAGKAQAIRDAIQAWRLPDPIPASLDFSPSSPNLPPLFDQVSSLDQRRSPPKAIADFIAQESLYAPDINDGVRVNIAPLQKAGVLAADVLAAKDVDKAIADRAEWRSDERRWVREGKLRQPGWWSQPNQITDEVEAAVGTMLQPELTAPGRIRPDRMDDALYGLTVLKEMLLLRPDGIEPIQLAEAFCLLADKDRLFDLLKTYVNAVDDTAASHWHASFDQSPNTQFLLEYLKELHSKEFAEYKNEKFIPGAAATPKIGWARYDASLALAASEAMPRSLRDEIVQSDVKEMVISLRLVG